MTLRIDFPHFDSKSAHFQSNYQKDQAKMMFSEPALPFTILEQVSRPKEEIKTEMGL
jgi:hypothetical protein